ncbi:hypothetical protein MTAT_12170 [Moorella thermoacetica]|uniref:Methylcobalamin:coenzyme M methyltransferase n=1 Tax=Neomoorella thermoacetica TaxID=1525 RepID=A0AAC9HH16_NEOTH|nr:uroporphyrinogen decarboxylase family protein [Moorella thermoacetica]AOQ23635.1 methylcobalamin:coenzyme M methyltransferase [Moorella thermoacetica]TYL13819.1 hypothetical protein MTAT_12170 [Moorella thermoacetica]
MKTKERFLKTCNFEPPDVIVTYDFVDHNELLATYGGEEKNLIVRNARMMKAIGLDSTRYIHNPEHHWVWGKIETWKQFLGIDPSKWEVVETGGTAWIKRPFKTVKELEQHLPRMPHRNEVASWYRNWLKQVKEVFDEFDLVWVTAVEGPLTDAYSYTDFGLFFETMIEAPELIDYLLDVTTTFQEILAEVHAENPTSPVFFMNDDIAGTHGPIFSPKWLRENMLPRWQRVYKPAKAAGLKCCFHSDGNLNLLMDLLVNELKIDGLNPIEVNAGMDIRKIRRQYPHLLLFGNVCCATTLPHGTVEDVQQEVKGLLRDIAPTGGLFLGSSSEVHDLVPIENAVTMYKTAKQFGKYPIDVETLK